MVTSQNLVIDLIDTVNEIGELTKLAVQLGYDCHVEPAQDERVPGQQVRFTWRDWANNRTFGSTELANMAMILAWTSGRSGDQVLERLRQDMVDRCYPMDRPMQDIEEIASGHEGHHHE